MIAPHSLDLPCTICMAPRGSLCQSPGGRVLETPHMDRSGEPVRSWWRERVSWRWAS